jgi:hypothetical protein
MGHPCLTGAARGRRTRRLLPQERVRLRRREGPLPLPSRRNIEGPGRLSNHTEPRQGRHLPGEGFRVRRVLLEAAMHHQQERSLPEALFQGRVHRSGQDLHGDQALPEGDKETQGVDRAFVRGGQALGHGMRRFRTRTLEKVNAEALMTAAGQNIKRLLAFGRREPKKLAQAAALRPPDRLLPDLAHRTLRDHHHQRRIDSRFSTRWIIFGTSLKRNEGFFSETRLLVTSVSRKEHSCCRHFVGRAARDATYIVLRGSSASAYGYTLTVWSTSSVLSHAYRLPSPPQIFCFILGAVVGFAAVGASAFGGVTVEFGGEGSRVRLWGSFHFVSVALAVGAAWFLSAHVVSLAGWPLGSFVAPRHFTLAWLRRRTPRRAQAPREVRQDEGLWLRPLFTGVRGRVVLGSSLC